MRRVSVWRVAAHLFWVAGVIAGVAGCTVTDSVQIDPIAGGTRPGGTVCASGLGSYALPRAYLHVVVGNVPDTTPGKPAGAPDIVARSNEGLSVETIRHVDPSLVFCLDYLSSPLSHDKVTVKKAIEKELPSFNPNDNIGSATWKPREKTAFLGAVTVNASDRTQYIIDTLLRSAFIIASGSPSFNARQIALNNAAKVILTDLEYDPFDPEETAAVNARLTKLGFCLVLEDYTFPRRSLSVEGYCDAPRRHQDPANRIVEAYMKVKSEKADAHLPGILYRPRVPYRLEIYRKKDPRGRGRWQLVETLPVQLENLSPVLSLDIHRAVFAGRNANFVFDQGTLTNACISKGSELEGFVDIPLVISRSILQLPATIVAVRVDQIENQKKLVEAEGKLFQVQQAYLQALATGQYQPGVTVGNKLDPAFTLPNILASETGGPPVELSAAVYADADPFNQNLTKLCAGG